jgi:hypothetical protein
MRRSSASNFIERRVAKVQGGAQRRAEIRAQSAAQLPLGYTVADSKPRSHTCSVQLVPLNPTRLATPSPLSFWAKHDVT